MLNIMIEIELKQKVLDAIDDLRPYLKNDGGDMELVDITPEKKVLVRFLGACKSCSVRIRLHSKLDSKNH